MQITRHSAAILVILQRPRLSLGLISNCLGRFSTTPEMATNTQTFAYAAEAQHYVSQQHSPASSTSPASPRINDYLQQIAPNPYKQLRPLKSPLYVPAVLRPTEHFSKISPMTPPKSIHGSLDNLHDEQVDETLEPDQFAFTGVESEWLQDEELGEVTGPPTRDHWKVCFPRSRYTLTIQYLSKFSKFYPRLMS